MSSFTLKVLSVQKIPLLLMTYKFQPFLASEEQISAMRKELEKYGIQMPAFSKIGGILESEVCK